MVRRLATVLSLLALAAVSCLGSQFQFYRTEWAVALFTNGTAETFHGLRIGFPSDVTPTQTLGIGTNLTLESSEEGILRFEGTIPPLTTWEIDWPIDGPRIVDAAWVRADGSEVPIDTHAPIADMRISFPLGLWGFCPEERRIPFFPIDGTFSAAGSYDPDEEPLTDYQWEWSDGERARGSRVERWFYRPGRYTVTLTVWDAQGDSDTVTKIFLIPEWTCSSCCQP